MARVTIEDCLEKVQDRFELVALAAQRAKNIGSGADITIERKGEKDTVISLREIAEGTIEVADLKEGLTSSFQRIKDPVQNFEEALLSNSGSDDIDIDAEEADIRAAMDEAQETNLQSADEEYDEAEGFTQEGEEIIEEEITE